MKFKILPVLFILGFASQLHSMDSIKKWTAEHEELTAWCRGISVGFLGTQIAKYVVFKNGVNMEAAKGVIRLIFILKAVNILSPWEKKKFKRFLGTAIGETLAMANW